MERRLAEMTESREAEEMTETFQSAKSNSLVEINDEEEESVQVLLISLFI